MITDTLLSPENGPAAEARINPEIFQAVCLNVKDILKAHPRTELYAGGVFDLRLQAKDIPYVEELKIKLEDDDSLLFTYVDERFVTDGDWQGTVVYGRRKDYRLYSAHRNGTIGRYTGCVAGADPMREFPSVDDTEAEDLAWDLLDLRQHLQKHGVLLPRGQNAF